MNFWTVNLEALGKRPDVQSQKLFQVLGQGGPANSQEFPRAKSGAPVPWVEAQGRKIPVSSLYDGEKEAERWVDQVPGWGCLWVWGLAPPTVWSRLLVQKRTLVAAEGRLEVWQRSLSAADWSTVIAHPRWNPFFFQTEEVSRMLNRTYSVVLDGPFQTADWRSLDWEGFTLGRTRLQEALDHQSGDFSTQARLGRRWMRNTLVNFHNLRPGSFAPVNPPVAAVAGAGPGLETALEDPQNLRLINGRPHNGFLLVATDTALGTLWERKIKPDLALCLDGQLASYHHFVPPIWPDLPILADLGALPLVARLPNPVLFALSAHPLHRLIGREFPELPFLDTSLGNVAGWGLRVCEFLGSRKTLLWGADCSYPQGKAYARDTYITPYFLRRSHRLTPLETHLAAFAWRTPGVIREKVGPTIRYTNSLLLSYKDRLESQAAGFETPLEAFAGPGLELHLTWSGHQRTGQVLHQPGSSHRSRAFLDRWKSLVENLPLPDSDTCPRDFFVSLDQPTLGLWTALLPLAAHILRRSLGSLPVSAQVLNRVLGETKLEALDLSNLV